MNFDLLPFVPGDMLREMVNSLEGRLRTDIQVREGDFEETDEPASAQGGFKDWIPHVTINARRRMEFDEHAFAHELLHIKRFVDGAFSLETPEYVAGIRTPDATIRKAFASDFTNQIEHIAIFPQLVELGFDPHSQADEWKRRQLGDLKFSRQFGPVQHSWCAVKLGVSEFLGQSTDVQQQYREAMERASPGAIEKGAEITALIKRFGTAKPYNLKRLYQMSLRAAGVPSGMLILKQLDFANRREALEPVP